MTDGATLRAWKQRALMAEGLVESLRAELETERMKVAACGVCAMQNTEGSKAERITKDNPYWSASYGDVCRAVDAEIKFREDYLLACQTVAKMHEAAVGAITGPIRGVVEDVADVRAERDADVAALTHISKTIGKQLNLIEERAPGKFLDKPAVVSSLKMHKRTCDAAIKGEAP